MKKVSILLMALAAMTIAACSQKGAGDEKQTNETTMDSVKAIPQTDAKVVVLLAHPDLGKSHMNAALSTAAAEVEGVQVINIYDHPVQPDAYREVIGRAKAIVYEFPLYWMSSPHLLKQWTDEVFMAFVQEGMIEGKEFMVVATTGSEESAYQHGGRNKYTMDEYLRPFEGQANHAKMHWNAPLVVYGNPQSAEALEAGLKKGCETYKARLQELVAKAK